MMAHLKVFRKPFHTDPYLNYRSFHHPAIKYSVCKTLVNSAYNVCDKGSITKELDHLKVVLQQKGFQADKIFLTSPTPSNKSKQEFSTSVYVFRISTQLHI